MLLSKSLCHHLPVELLSLTRSHPSIPRFSRLLSTSSSRATSAVPPKHFYATTPIFYVNAGESTVLLELSTGSQAKVFAPNRSSHRSFAFNAARRRLYSV